jgi:hypothetical protein
MRRVQNHLWRFGKVAQIRPKCDQRLEVITKEANRLLPGSPRIINYASGVTGGVGVKVVESIAKTSLRCAS